MDREQSHREKYNIILEERLRRDKEIALKMEQKRLETLDKIKEKKDEIIRKQNEMVENTKRIGQKKKLFKIMEENYKQKLV